jgi:hypothetical protein
MRNPSDHFDDNTVVDFLARTVPVEDAHAVAVHVVTCRQCREMVETCRSLGDGLDSGRGGLPDPAGLVD